MLIDPDMQNCSSCNRAPCQSFWASRTKKKTHTAWNLWYIAAE